MRLGELINQRRKQAGMSLQDLADACGSTKSHLWEVEQGRTVNIGILLAVRLSISLGVPVNVLASAAMETTRTDIRSDTEAAPILVPHLNERDASPVMGT